MTGTPHHRQNLHNHTVFSDGRFTPARLIEEALAGGLSALGISDHFFTRKVFRGATLDGWCATVLPNYLRVAAEVRQMEFVREGAIGADQPLRVWFGMEIDTCSARLGCELGQLPWTDLNRLDYLLLEYVGESDRDGLPLERLEEIRQWARVPIILAHPDPDRWEETLPLGRVFDILRRCGVALELPGGTRNSWPWARREAGLLRDLPLTIGCDTHERLEDLCAIDRALEFLERHGLLEQLTDPDRLAPHWGGNL